VTNSVFLRVKITYVDVEFLECILIDWTSQSMHHVTIFGR